MMTTISPIHILLAEDSPSDAVLTMTALREAKVVNTVHHVTDGEEALAYLRAEPPHEAALRPDLILLDLNMPRKDGREVLAEIRADDKLKNLVVVVLTTSAQENDVLAAYGLNANAYISKPVEMENFLDAITGLQKFFLYIATLPPRE